jgi:hypothetical protein
MDGQSDESDSQTKARSNFGGRVWKKKKMRLAVLVNSWSASFYHFILVKDSEIYSKTVISLSFG